MRRVLVTGASTPLGRRITARLGRRDSVDAVVGVDVRGGLVGHSSNGFHGHGQSLTQLIDDTMVDTIVHAGMCPSRSGVATREAPDVISTQQLTAAISARHSPVRVVVAVSSTEVYPARSSTPQWRREDEPLRPRRDSAAALVVEAEDYLLDVAEHQPHINVAILRLADLAGTGISSPLASLWQRQLVPFVAGYDPPVQVLHVDDAMAAIDHAAARELVGTLNVAASGVVTWRSTARLIGRPAVPALIVPDGFAGALVELGAPVVPESLAGVIRFGRCVDTTALAQTGFSPRHTTEACIRATGRLGAFPMSVPTPEWIAAEPTPT